MSKKSISQQIAEEQGLTVDEVQIRGEIRERYEVALAQDLNGKQVSLKVLISDHPNDVNGFLTDEAFFRLVAGSELDRFVPDYIASRIDRDPKWYSREYLNFEPSGDITASFGFGEAFLEAVSIDSIVRFLKAKWQFGNSEEAQNTFKDLASPDLFDQALYTFDKYREVVGGRLVEKSKTLLQKDKKDVLANKRFFCHRDLYPQNVFYSEDLPIVIDWERCGYSFPLYDAAFLYLMSWQYGEWQENFRNQVFAAFRDFSGVSNLSDDEIYDWWGKMLVYWMSRLLAHTILMEEEHRRKKNKDLNTAESFLQYLFDSMEEIVA